MAGAPALGPRPCLLYVGSIQVLGPLPGGRVGRRVGALPRSWLHLCFSDSPFASLCAPLWLRPDPALPLVPGTSGLAEDARCAPRGQVCEANPSVFLELPHGPLGAFPAGNRWLGLGSGLVDPPCLSHGPHMPVSPMPVCVHLIPLGSSGPGKPFCPGAAVLRGASRMWNGLCGLFPGRDVRGLPDKAPGFSPSRP